IRATGGRGMWSNALAGFATEVRGRSDLQVVSLDWGFNEQLLFLTEGPRLVEPFWGLPPGVRLEISPAPGIIYLVHPPVYTEVPLGARFLRFCRSLPPQSVSIHPYRDRQGQ